MGFSLEVFPMVPEKIGSSAGRPKRVDIASRPRPGHQAGVGG